VYNDIYYVIALEPVLVKIVIQGKRKAADGTLFGRVFVKCRVYDFFKAKLGQANVGVFFDYKDVVKIKGDFQGIGIYG